MYFSFCKFKLHGYIGLEWSHIGLSKMSSMMLISMIACNGVF